jgi:hypothetical protein
MGVTEIQITIGFLLAEKWVYNLRYIAAIARLAQCQNTAEGGSNSSTDAYTTAMSRLTAMSSIPEVDMSTFYALVIWACASGADCPPHVATDQIPHRAECMFGPTAMVEVRKFLRDRPRWKLEKFGCVPVHRLPYVLGHNMA